MSVLEDCYSRVRANPQRIVLADAGDQRPGRQLLGQQHRRGLLRHSSNANSSTSTKFATCDQARHEIFAWIGRYNTQRLHSTLNYNTPTEWEHNYNQQRDLNQDA